MKHKLIILISSFIILVSCKTDNVNGIIIGNTLVSNQSLKRNFEIKDLIKKALKSDVNAIIDLKNFPNGGAASSYDLGYVITQIIFRIGENKFIDLVKKFPKSEQNFKGLIDVGLEYGDNDYDGKMDNKSFKNELPKLYEYLNE